MSADTAVQQGGDSPRTAPAGDKTPERATPSPLAVDPVARTRSLAHRMSGYSQSRSRQTSLVFPLFHSSLPYALVRDFAYPPYHPLHYGPVEEIHSAASASVGDFDTSRRVSDPPPWDASNGPWRDSSSVDSAQPLPSTSFGLGYEEEYEEDFGSSRRMSRHRKSKSYTNIDEARGRRRNSKDARGLHAAGHTGPAGALPFDRNDSGFSSDGQLRETHNNCGPGYDLSIVGDMKHPPFREDSDLVPYSPSAYEDHRPESASLDESFAGPSLALYDFHPENDNELRLTEGQIIQVGYRHGQGWLVAMDRETGEQGLVPESYVRLLRDIEGDWGQSLDEALVAHYGGQEPEQEDMTEMQATTPTEP